MRVFVYYNLHKKLWSIRALEGEMRGRVVDHSEYVVLNNPVGRVSEAGRQRVIRDKHKNVHAGLVGTLEHDAVFMPPAREITYNPYKYTSFVYKDTGEAFTTATIAVLDNRTVCVV